jgi:hypothetical protein
MAVKLQGEHRFDVPRQAVWRALLDPEVLARTLPGCEKLERTGDNQFAGVLNLRVGPVQGKFQGKVTLSDLEPEDGYHLVVDGSGAPGFVKGEGSVRLEDAEGGGTLLRYDLDAQVGGRIAGVGQRLLDSSAKVVTRQALEGLERQLAASPSEAEATAGGAEAAGAGEAGPAPAAEAPSQAAFAARFVGGLLGELVPPERRPLAVAVVLVVAAAVVIVAVRACGG